RVTAAVPVRYPLLAPAAGWLAPRKAPAASAPPAAATASTATTPAATQRPRPPPLAGRDRRPPAPPGHPLPPQARHPPHRLPRPARPPAHQLRCRSSRLPPFLRPGGTPGPAYLGLELPEPGQPGGSDTPHARAAASNCGELVSMLDGGRARKL